MYYVTQKTLHMYAIMDLDLAVDLSKIAELSLQRHILWTSTVCLDPREDDQYAQAGVVAAGVGSNEKGPASPVIRGVYTCRYRQFSLLDRLGGNYISLCSWRM